MGAVRKYIPITVLVVIIFVLLSNYILIPNLSFGLPNLFMYMIYGLFVFIPYNKPSIFGSLYLVFIFKPKLYSSTNLR